MMRIRMKQKATDIEYLQEEYAKKMYSMSYNSFCSFLFSIWYQSPYPLEVKKTYTTATWRDPYIDQRGSWLQGLWISLIVFNSHRCLLCIAS